MNEGRRWLRDHIGPNKQQYKAAHPEVDWDRHEVLYSIITQALHQERRIITEIRDHHVKTDLNELFHMLDDSDGVPRGTNARRDWEQKQEMARAKARRVDDDDIW